MACRVRLIKVIGFEARLLHEEALARARIVYKGKWRVFAGMNNLAIALLFLVERERPGNSTVKPSRALLRRSVLSII